MVAGEVERVAETARHVLMHVLLRWPMREGRVRERDRESASARERAPQASESERACVHASARVLSPCTDREQNAREHASARAGGESAAVDEAKRTGTETGAGAKPTPGGGW